ncbi:glycine zipper 2TM domain-containing protein [Luteimonas sp. MC1825]|uniref:glycine zipper 2TM domain-containing protein n=1 Tax=Luteimonas sp. MC1825 TaxID=2761107 RepID=UPI001607EE78|nr:glycine zipper 2TM domain-containing protein [Luteimonas sp. MC1825]MBB6599008.1 glycine zipper 2TM domain-containing protein [Luteimonas sp. MC1825]QOC89144.1 glycine zipper 2TM domain-containing protein [Luteimonas sp. MC1825]
MKNNTLAIALASLLVGGVAVAAFQGGRTDQPRADIAAAGTSLDVTADASELRLEDGAIPSAGRLEYADVVAVKPVTEREALYATVIGSEAIRETTTSSSPRQVCEDVVVQERLPERDGNIGGTVAGAVIGGLVGNQVGSGNGRKLATVAGAVGGGYAGRAVDRRHVGGQVVERVDRQCRTVQDSAQSSRVVAYNVTYRNPDGTTGTMRTDSKPGNRIPLGNQDVTVGYDVTYRYDGDERSIRMDERPGDRLPVIDGQVVTQVASVDGDTERG